MKIEFACRQCGEQMLFDFKDKAAERCDGCGIIWEAKADGTVELELLQLVGGKFTEDDGNVCTGFGYDPLRKSVFPEILKENEEAKKAWKS
jgi:hypothetical protein